MPHIPGHEYSPQRRLSYGRTSQPEQPLGRDGKPRQVRSFGKTLPPLMPPVQPQPVEQDRGFLSDIWNEYLQPGLETAVQLPGIKQTLQGLEAVQQRAVIPTVSRFIEPLPIRFEETPGAPEVPWYDIPGQYGRGDVTFNVDQYVTPEGRFSPRGLADQIQNFNPLNVGLEVIGENLNRDFDIFEPETRRSQNVQKEIDKQEQITGKPVTQRERRQIEEDLYKLPPGVRGIAEEAPWFALPPARAARASAQAARTGALGAKSPTARAALRATEVALKPVELIEEGLAKVIEAPFRAVGRGVSVTGRGINRTINLPQLNNLTQRALIYGDNIIRDKAFVGVSGSALRASDKLRLINKSFERKTGVQDRFNLEPKEVDGKTDLFLTINNNAVIPDRIRIRTNEELANLPPERFVAKQRQDEFLDTLETPIGQKEIENFNLNPRPKDMSFEDYRASLAQSPVGNRIEAISNSINSSKVKRKLVQGGDKAYETFKKRIRKRFPKVGTADGLVEFFGKMHDAQWILKNDIDFRLRGANPAGKIGITEGLENLPSDITNSLNRGTDRASRRVYNFKTNSLDILPKLGIDVTDVDNLLRALRFVEIKKKSPKRKPPENFEIGNKEPKSLGDNTKAQNKKLNEMTGGSTNIDDALAKGTDIDGVLLREKYPRPEQIARIKQTVEEYQEIFRAQRQELLDEGLITLNEFNALKNSYVNYAPIDYVDSFIKSKKIRFNNKTPANTNIIDNGIDGLTNQLHENAVVTSMFQEKFISNLVRHEIVIQQNRATKGAAKLYKEEHGLIDVSERFRTVNTKNGEVTLKKPPYDDKTTKSGFFTYFEDGKRFVFGNPKTEKNPLGTVDKILWDSVNGRNGLALKGEKEFNHILAMSNGWYRSMYTTLSPVFWVRNMLIDSVTVAIKGGVLPHEVGRDLISNFIAIGKGVETKSAEFMRASGGWTGGGFTGDSKILNKMKRAVADVDQTGDATFITSSKHLRNILSQNAFQTGANIFRRVGGAIESAPREAVFKKSLRNTFGKDEAKRLYKLTDEQRRIEIYENYKAFDDTADDTLSPFADTDGARRAGRNSLEATLDFSRGGSSIRWANNYLLFLNATMEGAKVPFRALGIDLTPVIKSIPVEKRVADGPLFEFGSTTEQIKKYLTLGINDRGITGKSFDVVGGGPKMVALRVGSAVVAYYYIMEEWNKSFKFNGTALYYDVPEEVRFNSIVFMLPPDKDENGDLILDPVTERPKPKYLVIPHRLREWNMLFQSATLVSEGFDDAGIDTDMSKFFYQIFKSSSPISEIPAPEIFTTAVEEISGYDTWRQAPIISEAEDEGALQDQYDKSTSKTIREAAGVFESLPVPEPFLDVIGSPKRLEHLSESMFGGVGTLTTSFADYIYQTITDISEADNPRPMKEQVRKFREEMNQTERTEFIMKLDDKEYEEFKKELKEPEKGVPFFDALGKSFNPQRSGAIFFGRQEELQKEFGFSAKETRKGIQVARDVNFELTQEQKENDKKLSNWKKGERGTAVLSPSEWREARSAKYDKYEGAMMSIQQAFKNSVQAGTAEEREDYYNKLYNAAGTDLRNGINLLIAEFKSIKLQETPDSSDWDKYNSARNDFKENIRLRAEAQGDNTYNEFIRRLEADDTETEKIYQKASELLSEYWSIGNNINNLYDANFSTRQPQIAQQWNDYLNADTGTQTQIRRNNPQINTLVKKRSQLRKLYVQNQAPMGAPNAIDETLAFWYGDFYSPLTPGGKEVISRIYGRGPSTTAISNVGFIPR